MGLALVRLLTLTALLSALVWPALLEAQQQAKEGQLDGSQTLFTVLAAINAAGYDANLDSNANSPVRNEVREAIAQKHLDSVDALKKFMADHRQDDPGAELNQYISFALSLQGPPDFQFWMPPQEVPPDVRKLDGLNELIANFYREAGIDDLWNQSQPGLDQAIEAYHSGVLEAVLQANAYLRNPTSGYRGRACGARSPPSTTCLSLPATTPRLSSARDSRNRHAMPRCAAIALLRSLSLPRSR